jgi:hypothetical protein
VVLWPREHHSPGSVAWPESETRGSPVEDRAALAHHVSAQAHASSFRARSIAGCQRRITAQPIRCHSRRAVKAGLMTNDRLTLAQVVLLGTYAVGMSGGQVLFKLAAQRFPASRR